MKFIKPGKVAILLQGRYAGRKAAVLRQHDEGTKERPYPHAIVAGIDRYPLKVTRSMGTNKRARRSRIRPFVKVINYQHMMPTRYSIDVEGCKASLLPDTLKEGSKRDLCKKKIRAIFEEKHNAGKNKWFFSKLRF